MALSIYTEADSSTGLSDGTYDKPFAISFDGRSGGIKEVKLFLRNDDTGYFYTDITIGLDDEGVQSRVDGTVPGFTWKLRAGDVKPTTNEWLHIDPANEITMSDLGFSGTPNTSTYLPFWVRIEVPRNVDVQAITTIKFVVTASENLI